MKSIISKIPHTPSWQLSAVPLLVLAGTLVLIIVTLGPLAVSDYSPWALLGASAVAFVLAVWRGCLSRRSVIVGFKRGASQLYPTVPMLLCIGALATTWMLSGVVPTMVDYGLLLLDPAWFLVATCVVCSVVSVLTGSSWSTIATIGVAFIGIGSAMGYDLGWTAGAIISGAYFGDKVSPLSDTTVIASQTCGVDLFRHIKYMTITTTPAMLLALLVFGIKGIETGGAPIEGSIDMINGLNEVFNITPWALLIPAITLTLIGLKVPTIWVLFVSAIMGGVGVFVLQPQLAFSLGEVLSRTFMGNEMPIDDSTVAQLVSTGGVLGMFNVVFLVVAAMVFGSIMVGSGMLGSVASALTARLKRPVSIVASTLTTGFSLNGITADQYMSIIITGNVYRNIYRRNQMEARLLSRSLEDGVSVTSPLIPWSSCGVTQSTVLGVPTLTYLPYCLFNYLTPIVSLIVISTGYKIRQAVVRA